MEKKKKEMHEALGALKATADTDLHVWEPQAVKMQPHPQESLSIKEFLTLVCTTMQGHRFPYKS